MSTQSQVVPGIDAVEQYLRDAGITLETSEDKGLKVKTVHVPQAVKAQVATKAAKVNRAVKADAVKAKGVTAKWPQAMDATVEFIHLLIMSLREAEGNKYTGVHSVLSGFNDCIRAKYGFAERTQVYQLVDGLVAAGAIEKRPCRRGFMIYIAGEMPERKASERDGTALLAKLGLS